MKRCSCCKGIKPLSDFHKNKSRKDGVTTYCGQCINEMNAPRLTYGMGEHKKPKDLDNKSRKLKHLYGITLKQYNDIFNHQKGCCAICKTHQSNLVRSLSVDHEHSINFIRGLLCDTCNRLLGLYEKGKLNPYTDLYISIEQYYLAEGSGWDE